MATHLNLDQATEVRPLAPQLKTCPGCGYTKKRSEFNKHAKRADGLQVYCKSCKSVKNKEYEATHPSRASQLADQKAARRQAAQDYVRDHLQSRSCVDCGEEDWIVLEFDHVRGAKQYNIAVMVGGGYSLEKIVTEIDKCDVRCANCHRRVTYQRASNWRVTP